MLNKIIEKWLGKDCPETPNKAFSDGYNVCIQDLKSHIPELEKRIEKEIEDELKFMSCTCLKRLEKRFNNSLKGNKE